MDILEILQNCLDHFWIIWIPHYLVTSELGSPAKTAPRRKRPRENGPLSICKTAPSKPQSKRPDRAYHKLLVTYILYNFNVISVVNWWEPDNSCAVCYVLIVYNESQCNWESFTVVISGYQTTEYKAEPVGYSALHAYGSTYFSACHCLSSLDLNIYQIKKRTDNYIHIFQSNHSLQFHITVARLGMCEVCIMYWIPPTPATT